MATESGQEKQRRSKEPSNQTVKVGRVLRSRRYKRPFGESRHAKRLFTPEIKRFLKGWLVRRRENPYPNREEKKVLAVQTGLTYIQICNWFANWRRKLKSAGSSDSWGALIRSYNARAAGNVEHFSISSDDSIWGEPVPSDSEPIEVVDPTPTQPNSAAMDHCYSALEEGGKYKSHILHKYLHDVQQPLLSKWLQSAARFTPTSNPRNFTWRAAAIATTDCPNNFNMGHQREEVDAAVALTCLARQHR